MTIHVKNDPILQVSSQEPSMSSKYDFEDGLQIELELQLELELQIRVRELQVRVPKLY